MSEALIFKNPISWYLTQEGMIFIIYTESKEKYKFFYESVLDISSGLGVAGMTDIEIDTKLEWG